MICGRRTVSTCLRKPTNHCHPRIRHGSSSVGKPRARKPIGVTVCALSECGVCVCVRARVCVCEGGCVRKCVHMVAWVHGCVGVHVWLRSQAHPLKVKEVHLVDNDQPDDTRQCGEEHHSPSLQDTHAHTAASGQATANTECCVTHDTPSPPPTCMQAVAMEFSKFCLRVQKGGISLYHSHSGWRCRVSQQHALVTDPPRGDQLPMPQRRSSRTLHPGSPALSQTHSYTLARVCAHTHAHPKRMFPPLRSLAHSLTQLSPHTAPHQQRITSQST